MTANPSVFNAHDQITKRLLDNLPTGYVFGQVKLPNDQFETPSNDRWLRLTINELDTNNTEAGEQVWQRTEGLISIDVFYPVGSFRNGAYSWSADPRPDLTDAEHIKSVFNNVRFNGVNCEEALIEVIGSFEGRVTESGTWFQTQINIDFYYEGC